LRLAIPLTKYILSGKQSILNELPPNYPYERARSNATTALEIEALVNGNRIICIGMAFLHIIIFSKKVKRIKKEKVWGFLSSSQ
jgi:hypothetical protein